MVCERCGQSFEGDVCPNCAAEFEAAAAKHGGWKSVLSVFFGIFAVILIIAAVAAGTLRSLTSEKSVREMMSKADIFVANSQGSLSGLIADNIDDRSVDAAGVEEIYRRSGLHEVLTGEVIAYMNYIRDGGEYRHITSAEVGQLFEENRALIEEVRGKPLTEEDLKKDYDVINGLDKQPIWEFLETMPFIPLLRMVISPAAIITTAALAAVFVVLMAVLRRGACGIPLIVSGAAVLIVGVLLLATVGGDNIGSQLIAAAASVISVNFITWGCILVVAGVAAKAVFVYLGRKEMPSAEEAAVPSDFE